MNIHLTLVIGPIVIVRDYNSDDPETQAKISALIRRALAQAAAAEAVPA